MSTMELEAGKLELIRAIININSTKVLENVRAFVRASVLNGAEEDVRMSKEDFFKKIDLAKASVERGEGIKVQSTQELQSFLNAL